MSGHTVRQTGVADAVAHIRAAIQDGRLAAGDRLVERTLADELGISSIAVRDALARLELDGYIERVPRRGARVPDLSPAAVREASEVRVLLEREAAVRAAAALARDPSLAEPCERLIAGMSEAAAAGDRGRLMRIDDSFHAELWRIGGQSAIADVLGVLRARTSALVRRALDLIPDDELGKMTVWHQDLLDVLLSGDADRARLAVEEHVGLTRERVTQALNENARS